MQSLGAFIWLSILSSVVVFACSAVLALLGVILQRTALWDLAAQFFLTAIAVNLLIAVLSLVAVLAGKSR